MVVDDHPLTLDGARKLLEQQPWVRSVVACGDARDARAVGLRERPHLALLDLRLPEVEDGLALIQWVRKSLPDCRVLVVSMHGDADNAQRCLDAGAHGYLAKDAKIELVLTGSRAVLLGANVLGADFAMGAQLGGVDARHPALEGLTVRELDVMAGLADGLDNEQIARRLRVSSRRVSNLISSAVGKTGRNGRVDLAIFAKEHGLASSP